MNSYQITIVGGPSTPESIGWRGDLVDIMVNGEPKRILVDCGNEMLRDDKAKIVSLDALTALAKEDDKKIDAVIITHNHNDHIGCLGVLETSVLHPFPILAPEAKFFMSPQSTQLLAFDLVEGFDNGLPYDFLDIGSILSERLSVIEKPGELELFPGYTVYLPQMGHIPGAFGVVLPMPSGNGFITGDWSLEDQYVTRGAMLPSTWPTKYIPDQVLGTDLTYGTGAKKSFKDESRRLVEDATNAAFRGEVVIIPAFMKGRGQNILMAFAEDGRLRRAGIPVWIDGSIRRVYNVYKNTRWSERDGILPELGAESGIYEIESTTHRGEVLESTGPMVVITTSGMMDNGPIRGYLKKFLGDSNANFFLTSYQAQKTTGNALLRKSERMSKTGTTGHLRLKEKGAPLGIVIPIKAKIQRYGLSAHNDISDFEVFLEDLVINCRGGKKLRRIILTHGTQEAKAYTAVRLRRFADEIIDGEKNTYVSLAA